MIDYRNELNERQFEAVTYLGGPELVLAGAGSGKTRVLTYKIAYLLEKGVLPGRIMALTFTNKAAREMKNRLTTLVGQQAVRDIHIGTFHSVFAKFLRKEIGKGFFQSSYTQNFSIYDEKESKAAIEGIIKKKELPTNIYTTDAVAERISSAKNSMISCDAYGSSKFYQEDVSWGYRHVADIYREYSSVLHQANAMDFDDILLNTYMHYRDSEERRLFCSQYIDYCLVDEYQDTNLIQKAIILQLTREKNNLFVVGDDAQSIYGFRGAVIGNILHFEDDVPAVTAFKLEQNYRSTQTIVNASNSLIANNTLQRDKTVFSNNEEGRGIVCFRARSDKEEAMYLVRTVKELVQEERYGYGDFAILYRSNSLSRLIEKTLSFHGIQYVIYGGVGFFQRREIKDVFSYFRVLLNPDDDLSLSRIINFPKRDIGDTALTKLSEVARYNNMSLWRVISNPNNYQYAIKRQKTRENIALFASQIQALRSILSADAYEVAERVITRTGIIPAFKELDVKEQTSRAENVYQLLKDVREFVEERHLENNASVSLGDYVSERALFTDEDEKNKEAAESVSVKLMTIHKSKGLEFPVVFIVGMEEDIFPCRQSVESPVTLEEERRLCYVAMTRAKKELFLTCSVNRFLNGQFRELDMSRFVWEIDSRYLCMIR